MSTRTLIVMATHVHSSRNPRPTDLTLCPPWPRRRTTQGEKDQLQGSWISYDVPGATKLPSRGGMFGGWKTDDQEWVVYIGTESITFRHLPTPSSTPLYQWLTQYGIVRQEARDACQAMLDGQIYFLPWTAVKIPRRLSSLSSIPTIKILQDWG